LGAPPKQYMTNTKAMKKRSDTKKTSFLFDEPDIVFYKPYLYKLFCLGIRPTELRKILSHAPHRLVKRRIDATSYSNRNIISLTERGKELSRKLEEITGLLSPE